MDYLDTTGRIFDIQRFSVHDGPGIRTIIFLKGCFLRCRWCCNPESQEFAVQEMTVDENKKKIIGRDVSVREVMEEVYKDLPYYRRSGGGVTLSGGESLGQPDFAVALLRACREGGLTTAMESTGFADFGIISRFLEYLDIYLMDIKHTDGKKHKMFTTRDNSLILENARRIALSNTELVIRVPVIPGFNDTPEEIGAIAEFAASLPGVEKIHLLPYHRLGADKYKGLGREYPMGDVPVPAKEKMQLLLERALKTGLDARIGG
ncbi:MAG: glycyl-radical enzyme activating protein [Oscillospiraceae bacterium]|nr:glycyl-radical enzyme activating protein [Oscillospiraceae bacterium]